MGGGLSIAVGNKLSPIWADIQKSLSIRDTSFILENISFAIGNGDKINFWHDKWLGEIPLKFIFNRLFNLSSDQDAMMVIWVIRIMGFGFGSSFGSPTYGSGSLSL